MHNAYSQEIGPAMPGWSARPWPGRGPMEGDHCRLEPLDASLHADDLYAAYHLAPDDRDWTYMSSGPFPDRACYQAYIDQASASQDPCHYAVIDRTSGRAVGSLALMRIDPGNGVVEVGHVAFSPLLQRTVAATEAHYLLMKHVFDELGYRRYEWKCDSLNTRSRRSAARLGFTFEGIFRQAIVYKGRSRDTAWHSLIDSEWPARRAALERWLVPGNFDEQGRQIQPLDAMQDRIPPVRR